MSKLYLNMSGSSSSSCPSSGNELEVVDKDDYRFIDVMCKAPTERDKRFLQFFRVLKKEAALACENDRNQDKEPAEKE